MPLGRIDVDITGCRVLPLGGTLFERRAAMAKRLPIRSIPHRCHGTVVRDDPALAELIPDED